LENFYYEVTYQAIRNPSQQENTSVIIRKIRRQKYYGSIACTRRVY
jgi:hypothetical protein